MATLYKFDQFSEDLATAVHDFATDTIIAALYPAASPPSAAYELLASWTTQIAYTNVSTSPNAGRSFGTPTTVAQTSGVMTLDYADMTITAITGSAPAFRYIGLYNSTTSVKTNPLIGWADYGSDLTLTLGQTLLVKLDTSGLFTIT